MSDLTLLHQGWVISVVVVGFLITTNSGNTFFCRFLGGAFVVLGVLDLMGKF